MINIETNLPDFENTKAEAFERQLDQVLYQARVEIKEVVECEQPSWDNLIMPVERICERVDRAWSPLRHLNSVCSSLSLRQSHDRCLEKIDTWHAELNQNDSLYNKVRELEARQEESELDSTQKKVIADSLHNFHLGGISLPEKERARFKDIDLRLSKLQSHYADNVLDCTNSWKKIIRDPVELRGLPERSLVLCRQLAEAEGHEDAWLLNLQYPTYSAVMSFAKNRALRYEMYRAYNTRASVSGEFDPKFDNSPLMKEILALRQERAELLGYSDYASLSVGQKMVGSSDKVVDFLVKLLRIAKPYGEREYRQLSEFAAGQDDLEALQVWDIAYYSELQKKVLYDISDEDLRAYFSAETVLDGLFATVNTLYGIEVKPVDDVRVWHPDVRYFEIYDCAGKIRGGFYLDLYARENKRGGAWMDECTVRYRDAEYLQLPIAYLTCNLSPPTKDRPALFDHDEVITLFHEFGHGLHHMLTQIDYPSVAGINGVEWDAVELPSQLMENWCWQCESINRMTRHYKTGESLPEVLLQRAQRAKNYQSGLALLRQIEFSLFDMQLHLNGAEIAAGRLDVSDVLKQVREKVGVFTVPDFNHFENAFTHIFSGGYAAGYFSYLWAEVLSSDAFSRFITEGIFNRNVGDEFLHTILERGGSRPAQELFIQFRGREPVIEPLLAQLGLAA